MININGKRIFCLIFSYLALLAWMIFIFIMSAQTGAVSGNTSGGLINTLCNIIIPDFKELDELQKSEIISKLSLPIRKFAHVTEFFILSILINTTVIQSKRNISLSLKSSAISFALGVFYAVTDEIHQLFVPGRAGTAVDVLIDSIGILFGCLMFSLIYKEIQKHQK